MLNCTEQKVIDHITANQELIIQYLSDLINFPTLTPPLKPGVATDRSAHQEYQKEMQKTLDNLGFTTETWEVDASKLEQGEGFGIQPDRDLSGMPVVVGTLKGTDNAPSLILNGHYDVVDAGGLGEWESDPFMAELRDGILYGRGACDMKGGIAAMTMALTSIIQSGIKLKGDIIVQSVPDEEASLMGTLSCCQRGYKADAALIPEPTSFNTLVAVRGFMAGNITIRGRAGHAELPQDHWKNGGAVNAIDKAVKVLVGLESLNEQWRTTPRTQHPLLEPNKFVPTIIQGGAWAISYPDKVEIEFTSNYIPGTEDMRMEIEKRIDWVSQGDDWLRENPPELDTCWAYGAEINPDSPIAITTMSVSADLGVESKPVGMGSLTDGIHLINYAKVPTISIGPSDKTAHAANECISVKELILMTQIIAVTILRWCRYE